MNIMCTHVLVVVFPTHVDFEAFEALSDDNLTGDCPQFVFVVFCAFTKVEKGEET